MPHSGPRRQAREAALQVLFAADAASGLDPESVEAVFEDVLREFSLPTRARARAREIVLGVAGNAKAIDECIGQASVHWKLHRQASVDRNLLRVATFELLFEPETPAEVIINEAVEIAHRFAGEASPAFVNGVLDVIRRRRDPRP
jgi:N utilization substance protein B